MRQSKVKHQGRLIGTVRGEIQGIAHARIGDTSEDSWVGPFDNREEAVKYIMYQYFRPVVVVELPTVVKENSDSPKTETKEEKK